MNILLLGAELVGVATLPLPAVGSPGRETSVALAAVISSQHCRRDIKLDEKTYQIILSQLKLEAS